MFVPNRELGDFLLDARLLTRAELESMLKNLNEDETLYAYLRKNTSVPEDELTRAAAHVLGVPFSPLSHEDITLEALLLIPEPLSRSRSLAAFRKEPGAIYIMALDLDDLSHVKFLEEEHHAKLIPHLTDRASLKRALITHQRILKEKYASRFKDQDSEILLDALLSHALLSRASEIHLEPNDFSSSPILNVRYRTRGFLESAMAIATHAHGLVSKLKELGNLSFTLPLPQEGKFKVALKNGESVRVRVATLPTARGEKITLHVNKESGVGKGYTFDALGFHGETLENLHQALVNRSGLVLVSGEEGSGKTTALYTMLDHLASPHLSIITVEEKKEMPLPHVTQTLVRRDLGQTVGRATRAALAHHPDVLMIGEIKNEDEAALAASAASRGIFVLAGVVAPSAALAMQKMLALGVDPLLLSATLRASMGVALARRICPDCKEEYHLSRAEAAPLEKFADFARVLAALKAEGVVGEGKQWKEILFARAVGCSKCEDGYKGFIGLQEILPVSAITKELIASRGERGGEEKAPLSIIEDALFKAALGLTSIEEVRNLAK